MPKLVTEIQKSTWQLPDMSFETLKEEAYAIVGMDSEITSESAGKDKIYKWVDDQGVTQFSSTPPPTSQNVQVLLIDPSTNVVQSRDFKSKPYSNQSEDSNSRVKETVTTDPAPQGQVYSPSQVTKLLDDARNVEGLLKERFDNQQKIIEEQK